jgi:hypothetical protein
LAGSPFEGILIARPDEVLFDGANEDALDTFFGVLAGFEGGRTDRSHLGCVYKHLVDHGAFFGLDVLNDVVVRKRRGCENATDSDR